MKIKEYKNGAWTVFDRVMPSGYWLVKLYRPDGNLEDKILCDDYINAMNYFKSFNLIARGM